MDRIASAKRQRASPDEDWAAEQQAAADAAKSVVHQACARSFCRPRASWHPSGVESFSLLGSYTLLFPF
jgi:hypothetical protein